MRLDPKETLRAVVDLLESAKQLSLRLDSWNAPFLASDIEDALVTARCMAGVQRPNEEDRHDDP